MGSRVENSYKEYIRKGMDVAIALAMAHRDETQRLELLSRPPVPIETYKYVEPYVSDEDRGPDPDEEVKYELDDPTEIEDVTIEVPTAHAGGFEPSPDHAKFDAVAAASLPQVAAEGYTHESLPGKTYKTAPALKAALTALAKREANAS